MRAIILIIFALYNYTFSYSQEFEKNPLVKKSSDKELTISSVSNSGIETIVTISVNNSKRKPLFVSHNMRLTTDAGTQHIIKKFSIGNGWLEFDKKYHPSKNYTLYLYFDVIPESTSSIDIEELYIEGGKYWKGIALRKKTNPTTNPTPSQSNNSRKTANTFKSVQQIRNYLASNIESLDPIEGEYDTQMGYKTNSPFMPNGNDHYDLFIIKEPNSNRFTIYGEVDGELLFSDTPRIESIGSTNAYRVYYGNSSNRAILENNLRLSVSIDLSPSDAKDFAQNSRYKYNIIVSYDFVKKYPTGEMYANVMRRKYEETMPTTWTGTGFALTGNHIVTNYHVVEGAKSIAIKGINGYFNHDYYADVIATDKINDIAILKVNGVNIAASSIPYSIKTTTSEVGEDVFVLGYPLTSTMGDEIKLTTGVISSKTGFQGDVSIYQISAPIQPGNSGGPLFDSKGNIIGIVSAKHKGAENVGYAIKTSYLKNLMESALSSNILPQTNKIAGQNLSGKVKSVKKFVYYIVCSNKSNGIINDNSNHIYSSSENKSTSNNTINPKVANKISDNLTIESVVIEHNETLLKLTWKNPYVGGTMSIDKNAYIVANGNKYKLRGVEGITYSPEQTEFSYPGETKTFILHFQAIPNNTTTIDFIENDNSSWRLYGISLKK